MKQDKPKRRVRIAPVEVVFWDHCSHSGKGAKPIMCNIIGYLAKDDGHCYYIASWVCNNNITDGNNEWYVILKSTVTSLRRLK